MGSVYRTPTPGITGGGWQSPWGAPAPNQAPGARFHQGDGYEYEWVPSTGVGSFDGYNKRLGPSSQSDLYAGDSYMRGMPSVAQDRAYELETQRMLGRGQLGAQQAGAVGQYGSAVANSLANQSIAAGNTFGQMANNYYNTLGQMGHMGAALSAAGLAASSNAANAQMANQMGINVGGGFGVSGPGGPVAQGLMGGYGGQGGLNMSMQRGGGPDERKQMLGRGFDYLGTAMGHLNNPNNQAMALAGLANNQFDQNRNATMNPMFLNSMNNMGGQGGYQAQQQNYSTPGLSGQPGMRQGNAGQPRPANPGYGQPQVRQGQYATGGTLSFGPQQPQGQPQGTPEQRTMRANEQDAALKLWNGGKGNAAHGFATRKG